MYARQSISVSIEGHQAGLQGGHDQAIGLTWNEADDDGTEDGLGDQKQDALPSQMAWVVGEIVEEIEKLHDRLGPLHCAGSRVGYTVTSARVRSAQEHLAEGAKLMRELRSRMVALLKCDYSLLPSG